MLPEECAASEAAQGFGSLCSTAVFFNVLRGVCRTDNKAMLQLLWAVPGSFFLPLRHTDWSEVLSSTQREAPAREDAVVPTGSSSAEV